MKKIETLFKKDLNNLAIVTKEYSDKAKFVLDGNYKAYQKLDGTACAIINGELYKRYDAKKGKNIPFGAIPCQEADLITGHHPHWVKVYKDNPADKYHNEALEMAKDIYFTDGTYELIGEKIQGNPEKLDGHYLFSHKSIELILEDVSYDYLKTLLSFKNIEGIVFHSTISDEMLKIRKTDFGFKR